MTSNKDEFKSINLSKFQYKVEKSNRKTIKATYHSFYCLTSWLNTYDDVVDDMNIHKSINRVGCWSFELPDPTIFVSTQIVLITSLITMFSISNATRCLSSTHFCWSIQWDVYVISTLSGCIFSFIDFG